MAKLVIEFDVPNEHAHKLLNSISEFIEPKANIAFSGTPEAYSKWLNEYQEILNKFGI